MGIDIIKAHRPLWVCKLNNNELRLYLDALNEFEIKGNTDNELLLHTAETWYHNQVPINNIINLANDIYKEAAVRYYDSAFSKRD